MGMTGEILMEKNYRILAINPGSTTTKLAYWADGAMQSRLEVFHTTEELGDTPEQQLQMRVEKVGEFLKEHDIHVDELDMIVARGAALPDIKCGAYRVGEDMMTHLRGHLGGHASSLAPVIAWELGHDLGIPCMIYDSVSADDYLPEAKVSGVPEIPFPMVCHVLNARMVGHMAAERLGKKYEDCRLIVAHLGGGSSVSAHRDGKIVDCFTNDRGQMSPERSGALPGQGVAKLCFSGKYTHQEIDRMIVGKGGIVQLLGTQDMRKVEDMVTAGDGKAIAAVRAMAYQTARSIAAMLAPLEGKVDLVVYTGGLCRFKAFLDMIKEYVGWLPSVEYPGEYEMDALVQGGLRILAGREELKEFVLPR